MRASGETAHFSTDCMLRSVKGSAKWVAWAITTFEHDPPVVRALSGTLISTVTPVSSEVNTSSQGTDTHSHSEYMSCVFNVRVSE